MKRVLAGTGLHCTPTVPRKKKTIYFTFDKRQKQNKSFQITFQLEILKKKMIRHYGLKL